MVFLILSLTACAKPLPDPAPAVQAFFDEFFAPGGEAVDKIRESTAYQPHYNRFPEASDAIDRYIEAYVAAIQIDIDDSKTVIGDHKASVSGKIVTVTKEAIDNVPPPASPYSAIDFYDHLADAIRQDNLATQEGNFTILLNYNKTTGAWEVDTPEQIKAGLLNA